MRKKKLHLFNKFQTLVFSEIVFTAVWFVFDGLDSHLHPGLQLFCTFKLLCISNVLPFSDFIIYKLGNPALSGDLYNFSNQVDSILVVLKVPHLKFKAHHRQGVQELWADIQTNTTLWHDFNYQKVIK